MLKSVALTALIAFTSLQAVAVPNVIKPHGQYHSEFVDVSFGRRIINLTEQTTAMQSLTVGDYSSGFQVLDFYDISAGIGPAANFWFNHSGGVLSDLQVSVGLVPYYGKNLIASRYAADAAAIKLLKHWNHAPMKAADLNGWTTGDSFEFGSEGGIAFSVGATASVAVAAVTVGITGSVDTYVEKMDATHFLVQLSSTKVKSAAASIGASFVSLTASQAKSYTKGLSFLVDVSCEEGARAYEDLVRGNVLAVQDQMQQGKMDAVQAIDTFKIPQLTRMASFSFGFKLFEFSWSKGHTHTLNDTTHLSDGSTIQTHYGVFVKDSSSKVLREKHEKVDGFYGVAFHMHDASGATTVGKYGQFNFSYSSRRSSSEGIRKGLQSAIRRTGLRDLLAIAVPEGASGSNQILVSVDLTDAQTTTLMALPAHMSQDAFVAAAMNIQSAYFAKGDVDGLCSSDEETADCVAHLASETRSSAASMYKHLLAMASAYAAGNDAVFADEYASFGRAMIRNEFLFATAIELSGGSSPVQLTIQGSKVSFFHKTMQTGSSVIARR
jgi:hypothetical protein